MTIGLYIGRFQPFHKGHLWAIKEILKEVDKIIIGIGSSQYSKTSTNPYSSEIRKQMIINTLKDEKITDYVIFLIPDIHNDDEWVSHIRKIIPYFDVVYTGSKLCKKLFIEKNIKVKSLIRYNNISASEIRLKKDKNLPWEDVVPIAVKNIINKIDL